MHDLMRGVHAGIGAPRGARAGRRTREPRQGRLEPVLHGAAIGLRLPALEGRAVIFEDELVAVAEVGGGSVGARGIGGALRSLLLSPLSGIVSHVSAIAERWRP